MNKETDTYLDDLSKELIKGDTIESPSIDFTASVMKEIEALNVSSASYKPLISKIGWLAIIVIAIVISFIIYSNNLMSSSLLDLSVLSENKLFEVISSLKISKTLIYAIVLFGVMFSIQIPLLKSHFNKQLN